MANTNNNNPRQTHVSPGIYTKETDLTYAAKSLGITTLGAVGEAVKGPALQDIMVENWRDYERWFGGTNPEKFIGSQYPKYELPYIAQSYLKQSNQMHTVRVLGLSGVNAGSAWVITGLKHVVDETGKQTTEVDETGEHNYMVIAVLRSRGEHREATYIREPSDAEKENGFCNSIYEYDGITYYAEDVWLEPSGELELGSGCDPGFSNNTGDFTVNQNNHGRFTIVVKTNLTDSTGAPIIKKYAVSLNPNEKNYIYNIIGGNPEKGEAEVYVEELYDVALKQLIEQGEINAISSKTVKYQGIYIVPKFAPVEGLLMKEEKLLKRSDVGKRYLYSKAYSVGQFEQATEGLKVHVTTDDGKTWSEAQEGEAGHIYTVVPVVTPTGQRKYYYAEYQNSQKYKTEVLTEERNLVDEVTGMVPPEGVEGKIFDNVVKSIDDNVYYVLATDGSDVEPITYDVNNYKEQFRYASTPWIVSEVKGSAENVDLTKLFRFHTISDGNASNTEVKVSIENIDIDTRTFDVLVRDFYDTDNSKVVYEKYKGVNLIPGDQNYIALKIGSFDDSYENVSKYITVEVNETDKVAASIPAGFMGYPVRDYDGTAVLEQSVFNSEGEATSEEIPVQKPFLKYNTQVDEDIRINKQYFGLSDLMGIDEDVLKYKGVEAYNDIPSGMTPGFHLDARILNGTPDENGTIYQHQNTDLEQTVSVDGVTGYSWVTVSRDQTTEFGIEPRIGDKGITANTIYEDRRYRKFTVAFYGGFDGWDFYRKSRSNSDDFKYVRYKGHINPDSGEGTMFSVIRNPETYGFDRDEKVITSDWYAYMSAIRQLANPKTVDINVLVTPGVDYVNQNLLVGEVIDIVEEERADTIYVVTTPDKPYGAGDSPAEMYNAVDVVENLEDSEIDSNYTCSYYPWVKYYDALNSVYVYLPPTRDVVRNFAYTDNTKYPWFAAAGWNRGDLESYAVKPRRILKLGEQDTLYNGRLNFINNFANEGMKIWGDKNMQIRESQMNRISKRRLLLHIRKLCAIAAIGLIFDPNDNTTKQAFESAVTPVLDNVMSNRGITDWRLEIDDSQEARDRLELPAKIYLKPQPNLEYITIDFIITPQGVSFDDV